MHEQSDVREKEYKSMWSNGYVEQLELESAMMRPELTMFPEP
jgi:hypothetical protein